EKGIFILVKTSNPSSSDFQNLFSSKISDISGEISEYEVSKQVLKRNYIIMAELVNEWALSLAEFSGFTNLGVVVGATYPNELRKVREIVKNSFFLIPGYGVQGAQATDIKFGFYEKGLGGIVNSSRGIIYAYSKNKKYSQYDFGKAAKDVILEMNKRINKEVGI
ncbi:MAG: hypothetical protein ACW96X_09950, partial [Promethearchaeota archaeon]